MDLNRPSKRWLQSYIFSKIKIISNVLTLCGEHPLENFSLFKPILGEKGILISYETQYSIYSIQKAAVSRLSKEDKSRISLNLETIHRAQATRFIYLDLYKSLRVEFDIVRDLFRAQKAIITDKKRLFSFVVSGRDHLPVMHQIQIFILNELGLTFKIIEKIKLEHGCEYKLKYNQQKKYILNIYSYRDKNPMYFITIEY